MIATSSPAEPSSRIEGSDVLFSVSLALLSTVLAYRFADGNQHEQIPIILRQLDPGYLTNDFFVNTSVSFGPRLYFAQLVAWISQFLPLSWTYAGLMFLSDLALIVLTQWAARRIVGADRLGAGIAAILTVFVSSIHLGDATEIRYEVFQPANLGIPGMLLAICLGWLGRPIAAAIVASVTSLPHPLYGVEGGAIALCTAFVTLLFRDASTAQIAPSSLAWRNAVGRTTVAGVILGASLIVFWWRPLQASQGAALSTQELFDILARFRSPHHYLPSQFRPQDWITTAVFCFATWLAFKQWSRFVDRKTAALFVVPVLLVGVGCIAGILFTEVWRVRAVLTLQPFRLLSILKWTAYLMMGWLFARYWSQPPNVLARPVVVLSMLSPGGTFPVVAAAGLSLIRLQAWLPSHFSRQVALAMLSAGALALWVNFGSLDERVRLLFAVMLGALFATPRRSVRLGLATAAVLFALVLARLDGSRSPVRPIFSPDDVQDIDARTARAAGAHTPADAVFLVPPGFSVLRIIGQRAVVVDFEATPFQDRYMREWRERIRDVYGDVDGVGFVARAQLDDAYRHMTDGRLEQLAHQYKATHAILYAETATSLPEIYANDTYRIVRLPSP